MRQSLLTIAVVAATIPAAHAQGLTQITGAGSTFAAPLYAKWGEGAKQVGVELNYQAVGSGAGQTQIFNRTVDFGASDAPVSDEKLGTGHLLQFPSAMGGVVVIVNIPGIAANQLKLTGELLADIYAGRITRWNDPKIEAVNSGLKLPSIAIAPIYRADGSGTTFVFTDYLSLVSPAWKSEVGAATAVKWPAGTGARGSDGVSGTVRNVRGGIGYVESAYAVENHLTTAELKNRDGKFVAPGMEAFAAAAANADWQAAKNFAIDLNNQPGASSWPIVSATYVLVPRDPKDATRAAAVFRFFGYGFSQGDEAARQLGYVPLPKPVKDAVEKTWAEVKGPDGQTLAAR